MAFVVNDATAAYNSHVQNDTAAHASIFLKFPMSLAQMYVLRVRVCACAMCVVAGRETDDGKKPGMHRHEYHYYFDWSTHEMLFLAAHRQPLCIHEADDDERSFGAIALAIEIFAMHSSRRIAM